MIGMAIAAELEGLTLSLLELGHWAAESPVDE
jgi:hypothetical protein